MLLERLEVENFKSIHELDLPFTPVNVIIGANGAGKSTLLSLFQLLGFMMTGALHEFVTRRGWASSLLHHGPKVSQEISLRLTFRGDEERRNSYAARLALADGDTLVLADERVEFHDGSSKAPQVVTLGTWQRESQLNAAAKSGQPTAKVTRHFMAGCRHFQFHDTSNTALIRLSTPLDRNGMLQSDGGNLAAILMRLRGDFPGAYERILDTIRMFAPFFGEFSFPDGDAGRGAVMLRWRHRDEYTEYELGPHQLSDGTLRMMALTTLLLSPDEMLPQLIVIDEPELGLHPYAIELLGGLLQECGQRRQIIVATQSVALLDQFDASQVVVADFHRGASTFTRLPEERLREWLGSYSLGELWEKNVLGGRPAR